MKMPGIGKRFVGLGLAATLTMCLILGHVAWKALISREAEAYGRHIVTNWYVTANQTDKAVSRFLTPARYNKWLHQPLVRLSESDRGELMQLNISVRDITHSPGAVLTLYTDCYAEDPAECFLTLNEQGLETRFFQPKSRPWYLATRAHEDWVLLNFLRYRSTMKASYPPEWGWALSRHFVIPGDQESEDVHEHGIWLNFVYPDTADFREHPLFRMARLDKAEAFHYFRAHFPALRLPLANVRAAKAPPVRCQAVTDYGFQLATYSAWTYCDVNGEPVQFTFTKIYDSPTHIAWLVLALFMLLLGAYRFLLFVNFLQKRSFYDRLAAEKARTATLVGSRLIHDFKKGILSQLNRLPQEYEQDLDAEMAQPDFKERLQANLGHHFRYLKLLNKNIQLVQSSLKHAREKSWVPLDEGHMREYFSWLGAPDMTASQEVNADFLMALRTDPNNRARISLRLRTGAQPLYVPEMSFFRILQNLWENYQAYGTGSLQLSLHREGASARLTAENEVSALPRDADSSGIGLALVRQILDDNFGPGRCSMMRRHKDGRFTVSLSFPALTGPVTED